MGAVEKNQDGLSSRSHSSPAPTGTFCPWPWMLTSYGKTCTGFFESQIAAEVFQPTRRALALPPSAQKPHVLSQNPAYCCPTL